MHYSLRRLLPGLLLGLGTALAAPLAPAARADAGHTHVLWNNTNGAISLWTVSPDTGFTHAEYGPYTGWAAVSLSEGPDGSTHVLWSHGSDGQISVWNVVPGGAFAFQNFGPYAGWRGVALATGADGTSRVLWDHAGDGQMSLWNLDTGTGTFTHAEYGPYVGWTPYAVAAGGGDTQILWRKTDGTVSGWLVTPDGAFQHLEFGPYTGMSVPALSAGLDGTGSLLASSETGLIVLLTVNFTTHTSGFRPYSPPGVGWAASAVTTGTDGASHVLWNHAGDGQISLWDLDNGAGSDTHAEYGPYSGWTAIGVSAGP